MKFLPLFATMLSSLISSCNIGEEDPSFSAFPPKVTSNAACDYVDLGLPSGLKWATCNLGATSETEPGNFYKWGETSQYSQKFYKWMDSDSVITKYCNDKKWGNLDNLFILEPKDDAAHVLMGEGWRMPTKEDFEELISECTFKWTAKYEDTNVPGMVFISKVNGNKVFFPACGYYERDVFKFWEKRSIVWSSSLVDGIDAWAMNIDDEEPEIWKNDKLEKLADCGRCMGLSIRGVYK